MAQRILVVEDTFFMREMIKDILIEAGYEVPGEADNGADAVKQYEALKPDLVIMDLVMRHLNGIDATRAIRAKDPLAKVVMLTALDQDSLRREAADAGAKDFIVKDAKTLQHQPEKVLEVVRRVLAG